jgi:hypothetical protein
MAKKKPKKADKQKSARIEVFRSGSFTAMSGEQVSYTSDDLTAIVASYDAENAPAPIVVGHPSADSPAYGWVESFDYDDEADRLFANIGQIEPAFADAVDAGRYKRISMAFFKPDSPANPKSGSLYPKHVGFLGGAAPAVSGLKPVAFAGGEDDVITVEFGEAAFRDVASVFQKLREFMIEKFGRETADEAVPGYMINWIDDAADTPAQDQFSEKEEKPMSGKNDKGAHAKPKSGDADEFANREADLTRREEALAEKEAATAHQTHEAFADQLIDDGRLVTDQKSRVVALMDAMAGNDELSFADGDETKTSSPVDLLKDVLLAQPKIVAFGETNTGDEPADPGNVEDIANKAIAYQADQRARGIEVSTSDAVAFIEKQGAKS